jgi:hypothetical protein
MGMLEAANNQNFAERSLSVNLFPLNFKEKHDRT